MTEHLSSEQLRKLTAFLKAWEATWPRYYTPDCCINFARIGVRVLRKFHMRVRPLVVSAVAINNAYPAHGRRPASTEEAESRQDSACWMVIVGEPCEAPGWHGHLVLIVGGSHGSVLLDGSIGQLSRPQVGIKLRAFFSDVDADFATGKEAVFGFPGCVVAYQARPQDTSYLSARGWQDQRSTDEATAAIIAIMRDELRA